MCAEIMELFFSKWIFCFFRCFLFSSWDDDGGRARGCPLKNNADSCFEFDRCFRLHGASVDLSPSSSLPDGLVVYCRVQRHVDAWRVSHYALVLQTSVVFVINRVLKSGVIVNGSPTSLASLPFDPFLFFPSEWADRVDLFYKCCRETEASRNNDSFDHEISSY